MLRILWSGKKQVLLACTAFTLLNSTAYAHVSEQGFVLLLPTNLYIFSGVMAVALTVVALAVIPVSWSLSLFSVHRLARAAPLRNFQILTSLVCFLLLLALVLIGVLGERDPLKNPLPLYIWTVWWVGLMVMQGLLGNIWHWINPWSGMYRLLKGLRSVRQPLIVINEFKTKKIGAWPAVFLFALFFSFALVDPAPDDPGRLAIIVATYWSATMIAMLLFGEQWWLNCGEFVTIAMRRFAQLAPLNVKNNSLYLGGPGWSAYTQPTYSVSTAIFVLVMLGCGSFDGLNETFWWLGLIGVNPLEFPGRSAIVVQSSLGLVLSNGALIVLFGGCVYIGMWMLGIRGYTQQVKFTHAFSHLAIAMLPIAFAYHIAHFLTAFLVNIQYTLAATSDPLGRGMDLLGLGNYYVTTGFLNTHHTVEFIWLTQAAVVVVGHIISVNMAHGIAVRLFGNSRNAAISQLPLAVFMVLYTLLGLWLLASPKGA